MILRTGLTPSDCVDATYTPTHLGSTYAGWLRNEHRDLEGRMTAMLREFEHSTGLQVFTILTDESGHVRVSFIAKTS